MDLYSIGEMVIDFTPGAEPFSYIRNAGGAPANVAIAAARNGLTCGFCGKVGDDDFGRFLVETLESDNVKVLCRKACADAVTTMTFVTLKESGERSFTFVRKPGADMFLEEADVDKEEIRQSAIVHAGSCSLSAKPASLATAAALRLGNQFQKLVSFDVNYRNLMWNDDINQARESVLEILPYVDLLKVSDEETSMFGGEEEIAGLMRQFSISLVVETLGSEGSKCFWGDQVISVPGRKACSVDTTGAGDAFWGGFLSSLVMNGVKTTSDLAPRLIRQAMEYGNAAGALSVQKKGAIASLPTKTEIEKLLQED